MSRHVGVRKRIVVAASSLGMYIVLTVVALGLADITGTSDRVSLLAVTVITVCFVAVLGIRTHRSWR
jgi:Na+/proline symporter